MGTACTLEPSISRAVNACSRGAGDLIDAVNGKRVYLVNIGALIIRVGFKAHDTIIVIRHSPKQIVLVII